MILLQGYPIKDNTQSVADYAETVAKAQLKKVVELVKDRMYFIDWEWGDSKGFWQLNISEGEMKALLKEVE